METKTEHQPFGPKTDSNRTLFPFSFNSLRVLQRLICKMNNKPRENPSLMIHHLLPTTTILDWIKQKIYIKQKLLTSLF